MSAWSRPYVLSNLVRPPRRGLVSTSWSCCSCSCSEASPNVAQASEIVEAREAATNFLSERLERSNKEIDRRARRKGKRETVLLFSEGFWWYCCKAQSVLQTSHSAAVHETLRERRSKERA